MGKRGPKAKPLEERFVVAESGCWLWQGAKNPKGYGTIGVDGQGKVAARVVYEAYRGPIPEGKQLDHLCRNHGCVNPGHLEPVTCQENILRGVGPELASVNLRLTHCKRGHELVPDNVYEYARRGSRKKRCCKACYQERSREDALTVTV